MSIISSKGKLIDQKAFLNPTKLINLSEVNFSMNYFKNTKVNYNLDLSLSTNT